MALVKLTIENSIVKVKELLDKMQDETETPNPGSQESSVRKEPDVSLPSSLKDNPQNRNKDNCQHAQKSQIQANINQEEFRSLWQKACSIIREQKTPVGLYISEGEPLHFENKMLTIGFYPGFNFHRENLEDKKNKKLVEKVFSELLKEKIRIEYTNLPSSFKGAEKKQNESVKAEAGQRENEEEAQQKKIKSNPIIDHALKIFDGSIIRKDSNTS
jgi:DNA polymerase-3 subunit gamma/tau